MTMVVITVIIVVQKVTLGSARYGLATAIGWLIDDSVSELLV